MVAACNNCHSPITSYAEAKPGHAEDALLASVSGQVVGGSAASAGANRSYLASSEIFLPLAFGFHVLGERDHFLAKALHLLLQFPNLP